jgi:hypothetical protein
MHPQKSPEELYELYINVAHSSQRYMLNNAQYENKMIEFKRTQLTTEEGSVIGIDH